MYLFFPFFARCVIWQYSIVYFESDGDLKYSFNTKPKLVTVPDTEILQVSCFAFVVGFFLHMMNVGHFASHMCSRNSSILRMSIKCYLQLVRLKSDSVYIVVVHTEKRSGTFTITYSLVANSRISPWNVNRFTLFSYSKCYFVEELPKYGQKFSYLLAICHKSMNCPRQLEYWSQNWIRATGLQNVLNSIIASHREKRSLSFLLNVSAKKDDYYRNFNGRRSVYADRTAYGRGRRKQRRLVAAPFLFALLLLFTAYAMCVHRFTNVLIAVVVIFFYYYIKYSQILFYLSFDGACLTKSVLKEYFRTYEKTRAGRQFLHNGISNRVSVQLSYSNCMDIKLW